MDVNEKLISGILNRDNRTIARSISFIENNVPKILSSIGFDKIIIKELNILFKKIT